MLAPRSIHSEENGPDLLPSAGGRKLQPSLDPVQATIDAVEARMGDSNIRMQASHLFVEPGHLLSLRADTILESTEVFAILLAKIANLIAERLELLQDQVFKVLSHSTMMLARSAARSAAGTFGLVCR